MLLIKRLGRRVSRDRTGRAGEIRHVCEDITCLTGGRCHVSTPQMPARSESLSVILPVPWQRVKVVVAAPLFGGRRFLKVTDLACFRPLFRGAGQEKGYKARNAESKTLIRHPTNLQAVAPSGSAMTRRKALRTSGLSHQPLRLQIIGRPDDRRPGNSTRHEVSYTGTGPSPTTSLNTIWSRGITSNLLRRLTFCRKCITYNVW